MVGLIKRVTKNFQLQIPNYDVPGWGFALNKNFDLIDSLIFSITGISDVQGEWLNNTAYVVGDRVIDPDTGGIYQANTAHVSPSTGTFAADRAANPTRWSILLSPFAFRGVWTTGVEYRLNEFLYSGHRYGVATQTYTSGASYDADVAAGKIITLADLTASVTAAANSATASANSATAANNSAIAAAASAAAAATFDPANFYTKVQADARYVDFGSTQSITGRKTFANTTTSFANAVVGSTVIEIGQTAGAASAGIDIHSSGNPNDYDVRMLATGGTAGNGLGTLTFTASAVNFTGTVGVGTTLSVGSAIYQNDGNIQFAGGMIPVTGYTTLANALVGKADVTGEDFTGAISATQMQINGSYLNINGPANTNMHLQFIEATVQRAILYYDAGLDKVSVNLYNSSGVFQRALDINQTGLLAWGGNTVWHSGNDGAGSGLDADLLDGSNGTFYADIPARLGYTPVRQGGGTNMGTNNVFIGWHTSGGQLLAQVDSVPMGKVWVDYNAGGAVSSGWTKLPNGMYIMASSSVITTNGSGDGTVTYPTAFPTAVATVVATMGDAAIATYDVKIFNPLSTSGFSFRAAAISSPVRVNWIAIGY